MRLPRTLALAAALVPLAGCHSAYIEAVVINQTDHTLALVELDYPSASFGTQDLKPGARYDYRFKILGSGPTKLLWTDFAHHDFTAQGPALHENQEGKLIVTLTPAGPTWDSHQIKDR